MFCVCDHYEPGTGGVSADVARGRVSELLDRYPPLADKHRDCHGRRPGRTWFFPPHYHVDGSLKRLVDLCERGYGEIELHLHHGKHAPDTAQNLRRTIDRCIEEYALFGVFGRVGGAPRFGFIHGDWAFANSRFNRFCGVDDEIDILRDTGCYADFTFPSDNEANPRQVNALYYATYDASRTRSFDTGTEVRVGGTDPGGVMLVQGPMFPYFKQGRASGLRILTDVIDGAIPVSEARIDAWVRSGISVRGREDWVVVKTHTHGATDAAAVLGDEMDRIFTHLESRYNDGVDYCLHYVTARELYNIIKAAEAGAPGSDPSEYRDFLVAPPRYDSSPQIAEASPELKELIAKTYRG
ncbi:MAG: hypothetical protein ABI846_03190 [Rudaea sp.]